MKNGQVKLIQVLIAIRERSYGASYLYIKSAAKLVTWSDLRKLN